MIRNFEKADLDAVMELWLRENIAAHAFIPKEYWENNYPEVKRLLPHAELYVFLSGTEIAGFIGLNENHIEGIFVAANQQNKGIGRALLDKVKETRRDLTLQVYRKNTNAIRFYKKNGFIVAGEELDTAVNEPAYLMRWEK